MNTEGDYWVKHKFLFTVRKVRVSHIPVSAALVFQALSRGMKKSCFPKVLGVIGSVFLKATKNMISNAAKREKRSVTYQSPSLLSRAASGVCLWLDTSFCLHLPSFYGENFPQQERSEGTGNASIPKFRLIFTNCLKSSCSCNTVPPYCAFLHLPLCRHLFIEVIASEFTCSARLFISICLYFCTTRCRS